MWFTVLCSNLSTSESLWQLQRQAAPSCPPNTNQVPSMKVTLKMWLFSEPCWKFLKSCIVGILYNCKTWHIEIWMGTEMSNQWMTSHKQQTDILIQICFSHSVSTAQSCNNHWKMGWIRYVMIWGMRNCHFVHFQSSQHKAISIITEIDTDCNHCIAAECSKLRRLLGSTHGHLWSQYVKVKLNILQHW